MEKQNYFFIFATIIDCNLIYIIYYKKTTTSITTETFFKLEFEINVLEL